MKAISFYKYSTWALLILNIAVIGFFLLTKPKGRPGHQSDKIKRVVRLLSLDKEQESKLRTSAKMHRAKMDMIQKEQQDLLEPYFRSLVEDAGSTRDAEVIERVKVLESDKIEATYQHFAEIKAFLKPEQEEKFEQFMSNVLQTILSKKDRPTRGPKKE